MDERLLVEAAQQDPALFGALYEHNFDRVYAFVARRVHARPEAEDITAEVFQQALTHIGRFQWRGVPFAAWLCGIAAKLIAHHWQRAAHSAEVVVDGMEEAGVEDDVEQRALLAQLIEALPPDQRMVITARFMNDKSIRDIAQKMGRSEGAVKQLGFRALQSLRALLRRTHV